MDHSPMRMTIAQLLDEAAPEEGIHTTPVEGVVVARHSEGRRRSPAIYEPMIVFVGQAQKRVYLGSEVYVYDPSRYLVLSVPLPVECEWEIPPDEPLLLVAIKVQLAMLSDVILEIDEDSPAATSTPRGISTPPMNDQLGEAVIRLLKCLKCPLDSRILGSQIVREIVYRVLRDEPGGSLRALANRDEHFFRIARVLKSIHTDYSQPLSVEHMAKRAAMSVAAFHHYFKQVTATSPLQYIKRIRLDNARRLMTQDGYNAMSAAQAVGYESQSQFSREFKRLFGATPLEDAKQTRGRVSAQ